MQSRRHQTPRVETCIIVVTVNTLNLHCCSLLSVDKPKPTLTVEPESPVFTGESVTLKCEIKGYDGWTYQWYKQDKQSGWTAVSQSVYYTVNRDTLTIRGDAVINGDQYQCRGERRYRPTSSQYSNSVTLTVYGELTVILIILTIISQHSVDISVLTLTIKVILFLITQLYPELH